MPHELDVPNLHLPRIVIVGGGFGGIELAKKLRNLPVQVVMIDQNNYHTFQPLLYQVATAGLEPDSIAFPLRKIFKQQKNFYFRMAKAEQVLPNDNLLLTNIGKLHYDYLVLATGSTSNYFGMNDIATNSLP
ncbi:MAG TPA: FAD-dependent oxidoreductase, partial [Chitinophagales bacterium]|nr:FAD-dependent oxidoreductase [Chitinophagales bacterium]